MTEGGGSCSGDTAENDNIDFSDDDSGDGTDNGNYRV
jgi:hypothetical protein